MFLVSEQNNEAYWNSYRLLEQQLIKLSHSICFDDRQIEVYSSEIADIINSACVKIESLAKDIYEEHIFPFQIDNNMFPKSYANSRQKKNLTSFNLEKWTRDKWKYDYNCLVEINEKFSLSNKRVKLKLDKFNFLKHGCYILPFYNISINKCLGGKWEYSERELFGCELEKFIDVDWCKSYQEIKHNYIQSIKKHGTIKNAIMVLAAFYLLVIYYTCLPAKYFDWNYKKFSNYEIDFDSELFSCEMCYYMMLPDVIDSRRVEQRKLQRKQIEKSLEEDFSTQDILDNIESIPFFIVLNEKTFDEVEKAISTYLNITGEEKFDISNLLMKDNSLFLKVKSLIEPPYNPQNIRIAFNNGLDNVYNLKMPFGFDYEKSKYQKRTAAVLKELKIGDIVEAKFIIKDFVQNAKIVKITEDNIELSIKNGESNRRLSHHISNIIYIKKI